MNVAQSLMAGAGRSDPLMSPGGTSELRGIPSRSSVPPGLCEGGGFRFPAMNHWATLRDPSGVRHLQNALSGYLLKTHKPASDFSPDIDVWGYLHSFTPLFFSHIDNHGSRSRSHRRSSRPRALAGFSPGPGRDRDYADGPAHDLS